jgi:serpin B
MKIYILLFLFIALLTSCDKNNSTIADEPVITELKAALIKSNNNFSIDIFKEIVGNEDADKNVFISPLSMYYALSMAGTGSANLTKQEFVNVLGWANKTDGDFRHFPSSCTLCFDVDPQTLVSTSRRATDGQR